MPEFVKKTLTGYRNAGDSTLAIDVTHVIMSAEEYDGMIRKYEDEISQKERSIQKERERYESEITNLRRNLEREYAQKTAEEWNKHRDALYEKEKIIKAKDREISALIERIQVLEQDIETAKSLNENLLRIARERGNQNRSITPKKEHHGYITISSSQTIDRVQIPDPRTSWKTELVTENRVVWKSVLQTPYSVLLPIDSIASTIHDELMLKVLGEMGVDTWTECENGCYPVDDRTCIMYRWLFRTSRDGYWEVEVWTTGPVTILESNLMPKKRSEEAKRVVKKKGDVMSTTETD